MRLESPMERPRDKYVEQSCFKLTVIYWGSWYGREEVCWQRRKWLHTLSSAVSLGLNIQICPKTNDMFWNNLSITEFHICPWAILYTSNTDWMEKAASSWKQTTLEVHKTHTLSTHSKYLPATSIHFTTFHLISDSYFYHFKITYKLQSVYLLPQTPCLFQSIVFFVVFVLFLII